MAKTKNQEAKKELRENLVKQLLELMEKDGLKWAKGFNPTAFLPQNPLTPTLYRGINRMQLAFISLKRELDDPRWCSFLQASKQGWKIKKGAHSAQIERWKRVAFIEEDGVRKWIKDEEIKNYDEDEVRYQACLWGIYNVFSYDDIEGVKPYEWQKRPAECYELTDMLIAASRCPVKEKEIPAAYYSVLDDKIETPSRDCYESVDEYNATLLHEMAHSTLKVIPREIFSAKDNKEAYALEELRAELASTFASAELGIPLGCARLENHAAYLKSWIAACKENSEAMTQAITDAQAIADYLVSRVNATQNEKAA